MGLIKDEGNQGLSEAKGCSEAHHSSSAPLNPNNCIASAAAAGGTGGIDSHVSAELHALHDRCNRHDQDLTHLVKLVDDLSSSMCFPSVFEKLGMLGDEIKCLDAGMKGSLNKECIEREQEQLKIWQKITDSR